MKNPRAINRQVMSPYITYSNRHSIIMKIGADSEMAIPGAKALACLHLLLC
jgi:hypothetical protein